MTSMVDLTARAEALAAELALTIAQLRSEARAPHVDAEPAVVRTLLTVSQAGEALGMSRSGVYELIASGELNSVRIGSRRRVPVQAIDDYVSALTGRR